MASNNDVKSLLRNAHMLPGLYEAHFGKKWDSNKSITECAIALARKGISINRRGAGGVIAAERTTTLDGTREDKRKSRVRSAVRKLLDAAWEQGKVTRSINHGARSLLLTIETDPLVGSIHVTVTEGEDNIYSGNDYLAAAHCIFKAYGL